MTIGGERGIRTISLYSLYIIRLNIYRFYSIPQFIPQFAADGVRLGQQLRPDPRDDGGRPRPVLAQFTWRMSAYNVANLTILLAARALRPAATFKTHVAEHRIPHPPLFRRPTKYMITLMPFN